MRISLSLVLYLLLLNSSAAQYASGITYPDSSVNRVTDVTDKSYLFSQTITAHEMKEHLSILAADDMEGRETGYPGIDKAAEYIAAQFESQGMPTIGDDDSYFQNVAFTFSSWENNLVSINGEKYRQLWDYMGFPDKSISKKLEKSRVIFAGYGTAENYEDIDVSGEIVMIYDQNMDTESSTKDFYDKKRIIAQQHGATLLLIIANDLKEVLNANRRIIVNRVTELGPIVEKNDDYTNLLIISTTMAKEIMGSRLDEIIKMRDEEKSIDRRMSAINLPVEWNSSQTIDQSFLNGRNILGFVPGDQKEEEYVIVSAHYDHVGKKGNDVYNGADDNGSGTTTIIEVSEAFATAKRMGYGPQRGILFLLMTGEEKGLLGSEYYCHHPIFPIENTIVDVNIDMVGRWGEHYQGTQDHYIYVIGSDRLSQELHDINEEINNRYSGLVMDYKYNDENDPNRFYYRSDHYNFAEKGIPAIFFFNGVHADYHRSTDTVEKIDFNLMEHRAQHIFHLIWELANRKDRINKN